MEEHEHFGVEGSGANTVVIPFKEAQLLVTAVLGQQPLRVCLGHKGVINCMTYNASIGASLTKYNYCADACLYVSGTYYTKVLRQNTNVLMQTPVCVSYNARQQRAVREQVVFADGHQSIVGHLYPAQLKAPSVGA